MVGACASPPPRPWPSSSAQPLPPCLPTNSLSFAARSLRRLTADRCDARRQSVPFNGVGIFTFLFWPWLRAKTDYFWAILFALSGLLGPGLMWALGKRLG